MTQKDITPEGSAAPVYLDPTPKPTSVYDENGMDAEARAMAIKREATRKSALDKLSKIANLTEEEALAILGE